MSACVETMFYVREKPWHGLGVQVMDAPTSRDALILAGLTGRWNSTAFTPLPGTAFPATKSTPAAPTTLRWGS